MNKEPALNPNDPQYIGSNHAKATSQSISNESNSTVMVNDFVPGNTFEIEEVVCSPYTVLCGGSYNYNVFHKNITYKVFGKNPLEAAKKGFLKINQKFKNIKSTHIGVQKINANRENYTNTYKVRKNPIKNPNYTHKITFKKI